MRSILSFVLLVTATDCTTSGVVCVDECSSTFCLCDQTNGAQMITSEGTVRFNGTLVYAEHCPPLSLVYPDQCAYMKSPAHMVCPTEQTYFQCMSPCSILIYCCVHSTAFSNTHMMISPPDIYLSSQGRRLSATEQILGILSWDPNLSTSLSVAVRTLPPILASNHHGVRITLVSRTPSPSLSPLPAYPSSAYPSPSPTAISFPIPTVSGASKYGISPIVCTLLSVLMLSLSLSQL